MKKVAVSCFICLLLTEAIYFSWLAYKENEPFIEAQIQKGIINHEVKLEENVDEPHNARIDFEMLKKINPDICGWIYIPDTSIDYPVLIGKTDEEYLQNDMNGNVNKLGSIFSFADTNRDLEDARIVLFGHNMKDYQMFGELKQYVEDSDFRKNHTKMYVYTEKKVMELEVFSVFICEETDDIFCDNTKLGTDEYFNLLQELEARNIYTDIRGLKMNGVKERQSFSLVTCKGSAGTSKRLVVSAIVVNELQI